ISKKDSTLVSGGYNYVLGKGNTTYCADNDFIFESSFSNTSKRKVLYNVSSHYPGYVIKDFSISGNRAYVRMQNPYNRAWANDTFTIVEKKVDKTKVQEFVKRLYSLCMFREADQKGLEYWTTQFADDEMNAAQVAHFFVFTDEFVKKGYSDEEFIRILYQVMMGREADAGGVDYWLGEMNDGGSREYILNSFIASPEFTSICESYGIEKGNGVVTEGRNRNIHLTRFVIRMYEKALGREYDVDGLNYWCNAILDKKHTLMDMCTWGFIESKEFLDLNTSDDEYIQIMYRTFFDREFDQNGYDYWMGELTSGRKDRSKVLADFAYSPEFSEIKAKFGL
nr:DUF4214 domain-containing protein [Lachnospiraceae bacterium]